MIFVSLLLCQVPLHRSIADRALVQREAGLQGQLARDIEAGQQCGSSRWSWQAFYSQQSYPHLVLWDLGPSRGPGLHSLRYWCFWKETAPLKLWISPFFLLTAAQILWVNINQSTCLPKKIPHNAWATIAKTHPCLKAVPVLLLRARIHLLLSKSILCLCSASLLPSIVEIQRIFHSLGYDRLVPTVLWIHACSDCSTFPQGGVRGVIWAFSSVVSFKINCNHNL